MTVTPEQLKKYRTRLGLTQSEAAKIVQRSRRGWQAWETSQRAIDQSCVELFLLKTGLKAPVAYGGEPEKVQ